MRVVSMMLGACLLQGVSAFAQQQTGAPAGIPVPSAPGGDLTVSGAGGSAPGALHFRVHVVDGRNGSPIRNAHLKLWYDEPAGKAYEFATDAHGMANMPAPVGVPVRVLVSILDYTDCRKAQRGDASAGYNLDAIAKSGTVSENGCGQIAVRSRPGELVLFARPQRWYEGLNRNNGN